MVLRKRHSLCLIALLLSQASWAFTVSEYGILDLSFPSIGDRVTNSQTQGGSGFNVGVALALGFSLSPKLELEIALGYLQRSFSQTVTESNTSTTSQYGVSMYHLPIFVRYKIFPRFSLGLGPYISHGTGLVSVTSPSGTQQVPWGNLSWALNELGVGSSIKYQGPLNDVLNFVVDARYLFAFSNTDDSQNTLSQFRDLQLWLGITYEL